MKTHPMDRQPQVRDEPATEGDPYARQSFTWRRMRPWHAWTLAAAAVILTALGVIYI